MSKVFKDYDNRLRYAEGGTWIDEAVDELRDRINEVGNLPLSRVYVIPKFDYPPLDIEDYFDEEGNVRNFRDLEATIGPLLRGFGQST